MAASGGAVPLKPRDPIPWAELDTVFLDAGNTLASIDFSLVGAEVARHGLACSPADLERAESAARPIVDAALTDLRSTEGTDAFLFYLRTVLGRLPNRYGLSSGSLDEIAGRLVPVLRRHGNPRLWSRVLPGVPEALRRMVAAGLRLAVVSNSDGTVEESLRRTGLRDYVDAVFDSTRVGFEKPDRRIFDRALESTGSDPRRTLHVGDLYTVDVRGAWGAGLHAVLLDPFGDWNGVDCDRVRDLGAVARRLADPAA